MRPSPVVPFLPYLSSPGLYLPVFQDSSDLLGFAVRYQVVRSALNDHADHGKMSSGEFGFQDFPSNYTSPTMSTFQGGLGNLHQPIQPNLPSVYPPLPQQQSHSGYVTPATRISDKRKPESVSPDAPFAFEEQTRRAAEEDKRRRNTAASARFRVKKKQREQALEKSAKEMTDKVTALEGRIQQLETKTSGSRTSWWRRMAATASCSPSYLRSSTPRARQGRRRRPKRSLT